MCRLLTVVAILHLFPGSAYFSGYADCCFWTAFFMPVLGRWRLSKLCAGLYWISTFSTIIRFCSHFGFIVDLHWLSVFYQTLACTEYNELLHKDAAIMIIKVCLKIICRWVRDYPAGYWTASFAQGVLDAEQSNLKNNDDPPTAWLGFISYYLIDWGVFYGKKRPRRASLLSLTKNSLMISSLIIHTIHRMLFDIRWNHLYSYKFCF